MTGAAPPRGLWDLQRWFASITTRPDGVPQGARVGELERLVTAGPCLTAAARLQIYSDGYFARLMECLVDDYPALAYALDRDTFESLCLDYIAAHPSASPSLNGYGKRLEAFCRTRSESWASFAADLARLEWALVEVVHEAPGRALKSTDMPGDRFSAARFVASPSLRLLRLDYPANAFYQSFRDDERPTPPRPGACTVAVYRRGLALWRESLDPAPAQLLHDLLCGVRLEPALASLSRRSASPEETRQFAEQLPSWLGGWIRNGFFSSMSLD